MNTYYVDPRHEAMLNASQPTTTPDERAVALVRKMAAHHRFYGVHADVFAEARSIVADLNPVDEDLAEARQLAALGVVEIGVASTLKADIMAGKEDYSELVQLALSSLTRGRQLEKESK